MQTSPSREAGTAPLVLQYEEEPSLTAEGTVLIRWRAFPEEGGFQSFWGPGQAISPYSTLSGLLTGRALCVFKLSDTSTDPTTEHY